MSGEERNGNNGFIKLNRKMVGWEWFDNPSVLAVWVHILFRANWKDNRYHGEVIPRGSFVTSLPKLAEECGVSVSTLRRCLKRLENTGEIVVKATHRGTFVNVRRYAVYQGSGVEGWHADEHTDEHTGEHTDEQLMKNRKKRKNRKNNTREQLPEFYNPNPIRNPEPVPATKDEIEKLKAQLAKGKSDNG